MAASAMVAQMRGYDDHMGWGDGPTWVMAVLMAVLVLAVLVGIVWAIVLASRSPRDPVAGAGLQPGHDRPTARELLDQRYARGEIDTADYVERRSTLE